MTQRERILSIGIGGLFVVLALNWGFNQYRSAIKYRQGRLNSLTKEAEDLQAKLLAGAEAERQLGEYKVRSLSSDPEVAKSSYQAWLLSTVGRLGIADAVVDPVGSGPVDDLYTQFAYRVSGKTNLTGVVDLVYAIQSRDQLHRIREINFAPMRQTLSQAAKKTEADEEMLSLVLMIDAIALNIAEATPAPPSDEPSWRITRSLDASRAAILNRNFFQPPNQAPQFEGAATIVAYRGKENELPLKFSDPENNRVNVSIEGDLPEWVRWDAESAKLVVTPPAKAEVSEENGDDSADNNADAIKEFEVRVIATDDGFPHRQTTQSLVVRTQDPPPPPAPPKATPGFDDATQTFLTALVQGGDDWTAWMNVRTRGTTLKLKIGDEFEIGSISGKVTGVTARRVTLEINGQSYELRPAGKLSDVLEGS
ncbi:hypothetical protein [Allorhodopirellula heiligendammensis]|uniref:Cadherin domain-containing protein n=1 Tax=Allorhodopirellula heiligendammensis TaxID=2714739 RepID=A0A5C6C6N8_9BACT|nr:hypothetical protein [Allorhodopirellula heiligendammensis]TWU19775.1 hypothetical protein Poly21_19530 [Allorhodopirellula heiligendammensis]